MKSYRLSALKIERSREAARQQATQKTDNDNSEKNGEEVSRVDSGQDVFRRMLVATYEKQRETRDKHHCAISNREQC